MSFSLQKKRPCVPVPCLGYLLSHSFLLSFPCTIQKKRGASLNCKQLSPHWRTGSPSLLAPASPWWNFKNVPIHKREFAPPSGKRLPQGPIRFVRASWKFSNLNCASGGQIQLRSRLLGVSTSGWSAREREMQGDPNVFPKVHLSRTPPWVYEIIPPLSSSWLAKLSGWVCRTCLGSLLNCTE